jgi:hypothetical protein
MHRRRDRALLTLAVVAVTSLGLSIIGIAGCSGCPDEEAREEPELPPRLRPCTTHATSGCVFDPRLPSEPDTVGFHPGVDDTPEERLQRWLPQSCQFICARLVPNGQLRSCAPATKRSDGVYRATCDVTYDTCHDQGRL